MKKIKFSILLTFLPLFLSSCSNVSANINSKDYASYEKYSLSSLDEFYTIDEDKYFVYLYSDACSHCEDIKKEVFTYLEKMGSSTFNKTNLYIYNMHSNKTNEGMINRNYFKKIDENEGKTQEQLIKEMVINCPTTLSETYFFGTPSIYIVEDNHFLNLKIGTSEVISTLNNELINYDDIILSISLIVGLTFVSSLFLGLAIKLNKKK